MLNRYLTQSLSTFLLTLITTILMMNTAAAKQNNTDVIKQWNDIIDSGKAYSTETLMPLFEKLPPIKPEEMFGQWKGGKFDGGKPDPINWYGKRFISREYVEPLLVTGADGNVHVFDRLGSARLREMVFADVVSTGLIYDKHPILDYFRKINDDLIIGFGESKSETPDFFFYLAREK